MSTTTDSNPPLDTSTTPNLAEGEILAGCYALARRLSKDEDGPEVWLATDEVLGKEVTLHFLPPAIVNDSAALQELRQDIKRVRQLIHPNILRVYDLIEDAGWAAISMSAFEADSLTDRLANEPDKRFKAAEIEPWVYQLVQTVEEAHKINVLHGDLVPDNIYLTGAAQVLVASFGISRTVQTALARMGAADPARAAFASPQVLDGQAPTRADDIYSLGAVLYTLLTEAPPFDVGGDVAAQVRAGVTPETLAVLEKNELQIPPNWRRMIGASLQKAAEARPQTAAEFLLGLKEHAGDAPATIPAPKELPADIPPPVAVAPVSEPKIAKSKVAPEKKTVEPAKLEAAPEPAVAEPVGAKAQSEPAKAQPEVKRPESEKKPAARVEPQKPLVRPQTGDFKPRIYPEQPRFPGFWIAAAVAVLVLGLIVYHFVGSAKKEGGEEVAPAASTPASEKMEGKESHTPGTPSVVTSNPKPSPTPSGPTPEQIAAQVAVAEAEKTIAEKEAALGTARQAAEAAEKTTDLAKQQETADTAVADTQKTITEKTKASDEAKAAVKDTTVQQVKLGDDQKAAEAAVAEAQKLLAEKTRQIEDGKKALADLAKKNQENVTAQQKAVADLETAQKALADKQKLASEAAKAAVGAESSRQQKTAEVAGLEKALEAAKAALAENQKKLAASGVESGKPSPTQSGMLKNLKEKVAQINVPEKSGTPSPATPASVPPPVAATPAPATPEAMKLTLNTTPIPTMPFSKPGGNGPGNSLGMKFAAVGDVDFAIYLTRVKDFEAFASAAALKSTSWKSPGFVQGPDHPVVNVTWIEAIAFCKWLTDREHKDGTLPGNQYYRLPTDLEWSKAVGLPDEMGKTPEARDMGVPEVYPWGTGWPPPPGAGNYTGEETGSDVAIKGYDDGYAWTSPVGSFKPNKYGLYDMGGNVWQWCMDNWNNESKAKVLRGASWYNGALKLSLLSSCRVHAAPDSSTDNYGFRLVRATEASKSGKKPELR